MTNKKNLVRSGAFCLLCVLVVVISCPKPIQVGPSCDSETSILPELPHTAGDPNRELIDQIIDIKIDQFTNEGYFPQLYEANLQSIYFALYVLDAIDQLDIINQTEISDIIMSYYLESEQYFIDKYAERYLDTYFDIRYYPLTTLLEVNCYALLALEILDQLTLIDSSTFISFIWSCYNPLTSGFIGRPYNSGLTTEFKIATLDNTYYAVRTLDALLPNWDNFATEVSDIIAFINILQETEYHYGFNNDAEDTFYSLEMFPQTEPTIFSSYYAVKTLQIFGPGALSSIRVSDFQIYLSEIYHEQHSYFSQTTNLVYQILNWSNIVASAIGLELAEIYNFANISRSDVLSFVFSHRNCSGGWYTSTPFSYHELIDTFQIIRSLDALGELSTLTSQEEAEIADYITLYRMTEGYSPLCAKYMHSTNFADTMEVFGMYNEILNFDLEEMYNNLKDSIFYSTNDDCERFFALTNMDAIELADGALFIRTHPLEYCSFGTHERINDFNYYFSWRSAYDMLSIFQNIYKLDDYATEVDFANIISTILSSQFLNTAGEFAPYYGSFLPYIYLLNYDPSRQVKYINFEQSYFAIRTLELLNEYLELGDLRDIGLDVSAFESHITRHLVENASDLYFLPMYDTSLDAILENTYYMAYCLEVLGGFSLSKSKLKHFLELHLDYTNMHNIYYVYKLSGLLDLGIEFNLELTQALAGNLYRPQYNEFYRTMDKKMIDQRIFYYICDIAKFSPMNMKTDYPSTVILGDIFPLSVEFGNLIVADYGIYTTVRFESIQLGIIPFEKLDNNTYAISDIFIPAEINNYPEVKGNISIYEGITLRASFPISIDTKYEHVITVSTQHLSKGIRFLVEGSYAFGSGIEPLYECDVYAVICRNGVQNNTIYFSREDGTDLSTFRLTYEFPLGGEYEFSLYLQDPFQSSPILFDSLEVTYLKPVPGETVIPDTYHTDLAMAIPLAIGCMIAPLGVVGYTSREKLKRFLQKIREIKMK